MSGKYILAEDGKTPVACDDLIAWAKWLEANYKTKHVALDEFDGVKVSTVFLGLDHSFGDGPPLLWETMIFGGPHNEYQDRYSSYDDAIAGHAKALAIAKGEAVPS
jgi:hypothetical protein